MPRSDKILKTWSDWSAGVGWPEDDGETPGMLWASAIIGSKGELKPGPYKFSHSYAAVHNSANMVMQYWFEERGPIGDDAYGYACVRAHGIVQVETATVVGTITQSGNATVIVTAAGMTGSPLTLNVAVTVGDTASVVAGKIRTDMLANTNITDAFNVGGSTITITLTRRAFGADDATLNISIDNGTCLGLTQDLTSDNTTAGVTGLDVRVIKFDLRYKPVITNFGAALEDAVSDMDDDWGMPAKYKGKWYIYAGTGSGWKLTTIATGAGDTWASDANPTGQHLALGGQQMALASGTGIKLLKPDGDMFTEADWGSNFPVGASSSGSISSVVSMEDAWFVTMQDGLYTFNDRGSAGIVYNDYNAFRGQWMDIQPALWHGGVVYPHAAGLIFYRVGQPPVLIGPESRVAMRRELPAFIDALTHDLTSGRYHGVQAIGEFLYTIFQPDRNDTDAYLMCGAGDPLGKMGWQVVCSLTLREADSRISGHGIGISTMGRPESNAFPTGSVWFTDASAGTTHLGTVFVEPNGDPIRRRWSTGSYCNASGWAIMSELIFPEDMDITEIRVLAQNLVSGNSDVFRIDVNVNEDIYANTTDYTSRRVLEVIGNGVTRRTLNLSRVRRLILAVGWTSNSIATRATPMIKRIELYGRPSGGG